MHAVVVENEEGMHLLGLMLRSLIRRNLSKPEVESKIAPIRLTVAIRAGRMEATVRIEDGRVRIERGCDPAADASVEGTLDAFLAFQLRPKIFSIPALVTGKLKVRGQVLKLTPLLALTRPA